MLHGFEHNEDAVILRTPPAGMALVQTVDVLSPLGNNPRLFGQVAAANALSDVYAVGGVPWSAMNIAAFPAQDVPLEVFAEILAGGLEKIVEAGAVLAGGHTLEDAEIKYGLSVTGYVDPGAVASNAGLRPGDALVLTKPLGTGVLATAIKAQWNGSGKAEADLYRWATHLNANAAEVLRAMDLKAATDITGFGLGGHLLEMARGSRVVVEIDTASLPFIDNVEAFASDGPDSCGQLCQPQALFLPYVREPRCGQPEGHPRIRRANFRGAGAGCASGARRRGSGAPCRSR